MAGPKNPNLVKATQQLPNLGQSLWLDNITPDLLNSGTLQRYIDELAVNGLTLQPDHLRSRHQGRRGPQTGPPRGLAKGRSGEGLFFDLALDDLSRAADLFRPVHDRTNGVDGWVSLEVSPLLAHDTAGTIAAAKELSARAQRPNPFIKISAWLGWPHRHRLALGLVFAAGRSLVSHSRRAAGGPSPVV